MKIFMHAPLGPFSARYVNTWLANADRKRINEDGLETTGTVEGVLIIERVLESECYRHKQAPEGVAPLPLSLSCIETIEADLWTNTYLVQIAHTTHFTATSQGTLTEIPKMGRHAGSRGEIQI